MCLLRSFAIILILQLLVLALTKSIQEKNDLDFAAMLSPESKRIFLKTKLEEKMRSMKGPSTPSSRKHLSSEMENEAETETANINDVVVLDSSETS
jgi:hypothetical protein